VLQPVSEGRIPRRTLVDQILPPNGISAERGVRDIRRIEDSVSPVGFNGSLEDFLKRHPLLRRQLTQKRVRVLREPDGGGTWHQRTEL